MLNIESTEKVSLTTSSTAPLDVVVSYVDVPSPFTPTSNSTGDKQLTQITTATTTDILAAPAASTCRNIKGVSIKNNHASTANTIQVQLNVSGTLYEIAPDCILLFGESLVLDDMGKWFHYDSNGGVYGQSLPVASDTVVGGIQIAVQSDLEAGTSLTAAVTPGRQHYHPGHPKCWVSCGVAADIQQSYNVTSLTDTGPGIVTVTIANDFSAATYCALVSCEKINTTFAQADGRDGNVRSATRATGSCAFDCKDATTITNLVKDPTAWHIVMFGDLP
jgi:hypothetical protein